MIFFHRFPSSYCSLGSLITTSSSSETLQQWLKIVSRVVSRDQSLTRRLFVRPVIRPCTRLARLIFPNPVPATFDKYIVPTANLKRLKPLLLDESPKSRRGFFDEYGKTRLLPVGPDPPSESGSVRNVNLKPGRRRIIEKKKKRLRRETNTIGKRVGQTDAAVGPRGLSRRPPSPTPGVNPHNNARPLNIIMTIYNDKATADRLHISHRFKKPADDVSYNNNRITAIGNRTCINPRNVTRVRVYNVYGQCVAAHVFAYPTCHHPSLSINGVYLINKRKTPCKMRLSPPSPTPPTFWCGAAYTIYIYIYCCKSISFFKTKYPRRKRSVPSWLLLLRSKRPRNVLFPIRATDIT